MLVKKLVIKVSLILTAVTLILAGKTAFDALGGV